MALVVLLGPILILLLLLAGVNSNPTDEYAAIAELDYCGQSCPSSCEEAEYLFAVCRCDSECERYGDCCSPQTGRPNCDGGEQRAQPLAGLECRSIHLDSRTQPKEMETFWMVSACPEDWPANQDNEMLREVNGKCRNGSDTLPPVTDLDSGVVYKNEYCAVCHQVTNIQPWIYRFGCSPYLKNEVTTQGMNITRELMEQECVACGFHVPKTESPPRHCLHEPLMVDKCLVREELEERTGFRWEEEVYKDIVTQCQTGPVRPVNIDYCGKPPYYRNQYCAICNAEKTADLYCSNPYSNPKETYDFCLLEAQLSDDNRNVSLGSSRMRKFVSGNHTESRTSDSSATNTTDGGAYHNSGSRNDSGISINHTAPEPFVPMSIPGPRVCDVYHIPYASFSLFFDVTGDSAVITSDIVSSYVITSCLKGQVFDPINRICRHTICPEGFATEQESCAIIQNISLTGTYNSSNDSLVLCDEGLIALHESEFELLDKDTLLFHNVMYEIVGHNGSSPIICSNFSQNGTVEESEEVFYYSYPPILPALTYVGCSLSVLGSFVVLLTYSLFKELRSLPGQILMNLVSAILATCLFLMVGIPVAVLAEKNELCETTAIFLHWLILSQFSWMSIMSFELLRTFYRATRLHPVEDKSTRNKIFILYLLIGWGIPILITVTSLLVNYTTDVIQYGRDSFCWIGHVSSFYIVFVTPVAVSIVFNGITFIITFSLLFKASRAQAKLKKQQNISYFRIYLSVFSITGLTWIFGFLAIVVSDDWAWYSFIILTSTQGFIIAIAFICTQKVGGLYKEIISLSLKTMTYSKTGSRKSTQESLGKSNNDSTGLTKSAQVQDNCKPTEFASEITREKESSDQVSIKMGQ